MNEFPKISIVTPNFNGEAYLEQTIISVLSQNYPNLEYIIIDGGSMDNSVDIIKKYESKLAYWISEPDNGLYDAVQKGFDKSTGEIMAWINSDDLYHPKSFFTVAQIFNLKEVNWLQGIPSNFDEFGRAVHVDSIKYWSKLDYYLGNVKWIQQESVFWRRSLWNSAGGRLATEMKFAGDLELWLRFFRHEKLYVTQALLAGFRLRISGQISMLFIDKYMEEARKKIDEEVDKYIPEVEKNLLLRIKKHNKLMGKIKFRVIKNVLNKFFFREILEKKEIYFGYPPIIHFDRLKQKFIINSK